MVSAKFGGIVLNSTDNLVLSMFVNLATVGNYTNYTTVINGITTLVNTAISAVTASIGNLGTERNYAKKHEHFPTLLGKCYFVDEPFFGSYFFSMILLSCGLELNISYLN